MDEIYFGTGVSSCKEYDGLYQVIDVAIRNGIRKFDTAPSYGTEEMLSNIVQTITRQMGIPREEWQIQTKMDPWQMQEGALQKFLDSVLKKMDLEYIDSLLIHWPVPEYMESAWKDMEKIYRDGKVKRIGICNVKVRQLQAMLRYDVLPQIVQIERNPLRTCEQEIKWCKERGIEVQAYSPLCKMDDKIRDNEKINLIADKYTKSVGQIVLRWHLDTGVKPIFTSKKVSRIEEYTCLNDFSLTDDEINEISALNENYKMYLESCVCPGF